MAIPLQQAVPVGQDSCGSASTSGLAGLHAIVRRAQAASVCMAATWPTCPTPCLCWWSCHAAWQDYVPSLQVDPAVYQVVKQALAQGKGSVSLQACLRVSNSFRVTCWLQPQDRMTGAAGGVATKRAPARQCMDPLACARLRLRSQILMHLSSLSMQARLQGWRCWTLPAPWALPTW